MKFPNRIALVTVATLAASTSAAAQDVKDMTVVRLIGINYYGQDAGHYAYSFGTTSCNEGNVPLAWLAGSGGRVNIAQNMFRIHEGRVEQLGYSWLKLGFCAVNENLCGTCQPTQCDTLGVGCADTYSANLNDGSFGHGKADVNPTTGEHVQGQTIPTTGGNVLRGRLRVRTDEFGVPGAAYFAEAQYVCEEDAKAGNARNNNSWIPISIVTGTGVVSLTGTTTKYECAIDAWKTYNPSVTVVDVVNTSEPTAVDNAVGHFVVGYNVTQLGGGLWRYEYAVQNLTSDQGGASFSIPLSCSGVNVSDVFFRDVEHHSGSPYDDTDWSFSQSGGALTWEVTQSFAQDPHANALSWGKLFNFGFTADAAPQSSDASLGLFKPGPTTVLTAAVEGPCASESCAPPTNYCSTAPNSNGNGAIIGYSGTTGVAANDFVLEVDGAAVSQFGMFYYGPNQLSLPFGDGFRCVGGPPTFRLGPPAMTDGSGSSSRLVDNTTPPLPSGQITPGSTWNFQFWFRDTAFGGAGFNLSDGLSATFCP